MEESVKTECNYCSAKEAEIEKVFTKDDQGEEIMLLVIECKNCGAEWIE